MNERKVKSLARRTRKPRTRLHVLWHQKKDELSARDLAYMVRLVHYIWLQKKAIKEFLKRQGLSFDDFYHMLDASRNILKQESSLKKCFWKDFLNLCNADNLVELIELGEKKAAEDLFRRIDEKLISSAKAKQVLTRLFETQTNEKTRKILWEKIRILNPSPTELKHLLDLPGMYALHKIRSQMEKSLGKLSKEQKPSRTLKAFVSLVVKIEIKKESS